jgi:hypothetical protein
MRLAVLLLIAATFSLAKAHDLTSLMQLGPHAELELIQQRRASHKSEQRANTKDKALSTTAHGSNQCIRFMHIPKTGGTSIDSANMHEDTPAFDSFMYRTYKRIANDMPAEEFEEKYESNLGIMYDESHNSVDYYSSDWMPQHSKYYNYISQPDGSRCVDVHTSPSSNASVAEYYSSDNCTVFCAGREPLQRFVSAYEMGDWGPCDPESFEQFVRIDLELFKHRPYKGGCHFVPQVLMVYGDSSKELETKQYCTSILHQEDLDEEFNAFMAENGQSLTLTDNHDNSALFGEASYNGCKVNRDVITQASKDMIYDFYRADYEAFGYARP